MTNRLENIFIATFSSEAEETALEYGFGLELNDLCISSNLEPKKRDWVISRMEGEIKRAGSSNRKNIMHGPFTELTPAAIDQRAIDLMKDRYRSTIDICTQMGIKDIVLHDGYIPLIYQKPWHLKRSILFWKEFAEEIPEGFSIYIENVFDDEPNLLCNIVDEVNASLQLPKGKEKYSICLDVGHANAMTKGGTDSIVEWIKTMGMRIGHFHLHNNDGTGDNHDDVNRGTFDIERVLEAIEEYCRSNVTMTIESRKAATSADYLYKYYKNR